LPQIAKLLALGFSLMCVPPGVGNAVAAAAEESLYNTLGVERSASEQEIKKAYKRMALKNHPDKAPEEQRAAYEDRFKKISRAYEILSDPQKRQLYDQRGEAAFAGQDASGAGSAGPGFGGFSSAGADPFEQFRSMFGGGFSHGMRRTPDVGYAMDVTLEEMYSGVTRDVLYDQDVVCRSCRGRGASRIERCQACRGAGVTVETRQWGGGYQQFQRTCQSCGGQGAYVPQGCLCKQCNGAGLTQQQAKLPVKVQPGCPHEERFVFRGKADEQPDMETGDVIVEVREKKHKLFTRIGAADLLMDRKVSLLDALTGVRFSVKHLDGSDILVSCGEGQVVQPGEIWTMAGRGMPRHGHAGAHGDLLVRFDVEFPAELPSSQRATAREQLRPLLDPKAPVEPSVETGSKSWFGFGGSSAKAGQAVQATRLPRNRATEVKRALEEREARQQESRRGGRDQQRGGSRSECQQM